MDATRALRIAWPAFLAACGLQALVFSVVDPLELQWAGDPLGWSRQAVYAAGFFAFWLACVAAAATSAFLAGPAPGTGSTIDEAGTRVH